jgi:hypothetical protein
MSLAEILEELPKLTEEERERIREALDLDKEEDRAIDEGIRSLNEEPTIAWEDLDQQIQQKHGWA